MKHIKKLLLFLSLVCIDVFVVRASVDTCKEGISQNTWQPHSFSNGGTREILIMQELNFKTLNRKYYPDEKTTEEKLNEEQAKKGKDYETIKKYGFVCLFGIAGEYVQNFGKDKGRYGLGAKPFWSGTNRMTTGNNDGKSDLDAYQFGLGQAIVPGEITLTPKVQEIGVTFFNYCMQNKNAPGLYIKAKVTYGATYINPCTEEIPPVITDQSFVGYTQIGERFKTVTQALHKGYPYQNPFYYFGKLQKCRSKYLGTGDSSIVVGWNLIVQENAHAGFGIKFSYPMGNWPLAEFMLEPIFGTAGHPGLGLDFSSHYTYALENADVSFWLQADIMHYFPGRKPAYRSFDLAANGPGSKYLLAKRFGLINGIAVPDLFFSPVINFTTVPILSSYPIEADVTAFVSYRKDKFDLGIALEMWARSKESLKVSHCEPLAYSFDSTYDFNLNHYAVVGRQNPLPPPFGDSPYWCEPRARINKSVDAQGDVNNFPKEVKDAAMASNRIPQSYDDALDIKGATARRIVTGKFEGQLGYTILKHKNTPRFAIIGGVELSPKKSLVDNMWNVGLVVAMQY